MLECLFSSGSLVWIHVEKEGKQVNSCRASTDKELREILFNVLWLCLNVLSSLRDREKRQRLVREKERERESDRDREREKRVVPLLTGALSIFAMSSGSGVPQICRILLR